MRSGHMGIRKFLTRNAGGKRIMEEIGKQDKVSAIALCMTIPLSTARAHPDCTQEMKKGY